MRWLSRRFEAVESSYTLKHACERDLARDSVIEGYVANGELILGALLSGVAIKCNPSKAVQRGSYDNLNVDVSGADRRARAAARSIRRLMGGLQKCPPSQLAKRTEKAQAAARAAAASGHGLRAAFQQFGSSENPLSFTPTLFVFWSQDDKLAVRAFLCVASRRRLPSEVVAEILARLQCHVPRPRAALRRGRR